MKRSWNIKKLGEVCRYAKNQGLHQGLPYIGMEDIVSSRNETTASRLPKSVKSATFSFKSGVVLFGRLRPYLRKVIVADFDGHCSTEIFPIETSSTLNPFYLRYWFALDRTIDNINATCTGARMPRANMNDVLNFEIPTPSITEQQQIVELLDREFEKIDKLKENAAKSLENAQALFQATLKLELSPKEGWRNCSLKDVSFDIFAGGDAPKGDAFSKESTTSHNIPIYANAVKDDGLYGYTNYARVVEPSITVAARGSGTGHILERTEPFLPIVRLIVIKPNLDIVNLRYLFYALKNTEIGRSGSAIPQLTVPMISGIAIDMPKTIREQQRITNILDAINEKCSQLKQNYEQISEHRSQLKQAILKQAFNGEL